MKYILSFFVIILFGCNSTSNPVSPKLNEEFELKYGQIIQIQNEDLIIKFSSIIADSRCPEGAMCKWEGNAKISLQINNTETSLNTTLEPKETEVSKYKIILISLQPYPKINEEINLKDYISKLIVIKI
jgi:hypothetical protein